MWRGGAPPPPRRTPRRARAPRRGAAGGRGEGALGVDPLPVRLIQDLGHLREVRPPPRDGLVVPVPRQGLELEPVHERHAGPDKAGRGLDLSLSPSYLVAIAAPRKPQTRPSFAVRRNRVELVLLPGSTR